MTSHTTPTKTLAVAGAAALLALTGCSGGTAVFDFTEPMVEPAQSIKFRVPDELIDISEDYAEVRVQESVTVSSVESEDPSQCAVGYRFEYVDGGLERLLASLEEEGDKDQSEEERMARALVGEPLDSIELSEDYSSAVVPVSCAVSPNDTENTVKVRLKQTPESGESSFAWAEITVMKSGDLFVHEPEISDDWQLDSDGNWIQVG
ncbi:hypothetical protein [Nocardiopsis algeriensis]|uniref:Lipoprotein n=1 Tax=Nocardiopsis algeriensis TaxID=1478215 RepID=A0A841IJW6_9ACTN|nr:hypothetical protein [Nocardiopsis algeriensis]MBB6118953.1 hypothetical protein [Nocardiopsis algeriensis]